MNNLIIAIGDLHGHYRALERILDAVQKKYEIFGAGGEDRLRPGVQFVFTGDYIDRGRHALRIIDRLRRLAGIFWGRTFSELASAGQAQIAGLCRKVGVEFIVTGHTPHRAITVYGKRIFDIDVGMTPAYDENMPQALVFSRKGIVGLRADGAGREFVRFGASTA